MKPLGVGIGGLGMGGKPHALAVKDLIEKARFVGGKTVSTAPSGV